MTAHEPDGIVWQTSSYSGTNGACVEVGWRTSSYSGTNGDCIEVVPAPPGVLVRDSRTPRAPPWPSPPHPGGSSSVPSPADRAPTRHRRDPGM